MKAVYVIGHKNPDVDSIAAAISYKVYKQSTCDGLYIAAAAGELNEESRYILDYLELEQPVIIKDVGTKAEDILEEKDIIYVSTDMTIIELGNLMRKHELKTVPVLDEEKRFLGLVTIGDMAMLFLDELGGGREIERSPEILRNILDQRVADIMKTRDLVLFEKHEPLDEVRKNMLTTRFRNYPVVDEKNHFAGMISRYNLLEMKRKQLILVDHNEKKQAVDGVEEAEIMEIIDHHRVGDLQTLAPIYFHNEPVGSTCTLVAEMFLKNQMYINSKLAGLMLSGILSDTMILKSPTTTQKDKIIIEELKSLSGLDPVEWGKEIFEHSILMQKQTDEELIIKDLKEYVSGSTTFAISQVETIGMDRFAERKETMVETMKEMCYRKNYAFMALMVTDILEAGTELIIAGEKASIAEEAFGHQTINGSIFLRGVMSRKKQVVPIIYQVLRKENLI